MPPMSSDGFSRFEDTIQRLIEGGFARLFAGQLHPREVAVRLMRAMEDQAIIAADGSRRAPDVYTVRLHPQDHRVVMQSGTDVTSRLANELVEMARMSGLKLRHMPQVKLIADEQVSLHAVSISAQHAHENRETTQAMPLKKARQAAELDDQPSATLIVNGDRQIALDKPVINIGRQRDNDIILNSPTVSRHHAQIRLRFGDYVLFDLGSRGGTSVNGHHIQERVLQSGDVIGLAGSTSLLYLEDGEAPADPDEHLGDTKAYPPLEP